MIMSVVCDTVNLNMTLLNTNTLLNTITKFQSMEWKKQEWPGCADLAISYIHAQCQKFSQSGVPSPAQLTSLIEIIDEFIFR